MVETLCNHKGGGDMPKLDERLKTVARLIRSETHADVGSDHGHLIAALLAAGRVQLGIAIENKLQPFENSTTTLQGMRAEVRFGDGLSVLAEGEADSLSICGMGGQSIERILMAHPERVPPFVVVQPNQKADRVRRWAWCSGFHLQAERFASGHWQYVVIAFRKTESASDAGSAPSAVDPAYQGLDLDAAFLFGPTAIRLPTDAFLTQLSEERAYLAKLDQLTPTTAHRQQIIDRILTGRQFSDHPR